MSLSKATRTTSLWDGASGSQVLPSNYLRGRQQPQNKKANKAESEHTTAAEACEAGWLIYNPQLAKRIAVSVDVSFDEHFEIALIFASKPYNGAVPTRARPEFNAAATLSNDGCIDIGSDQWCTQSRYWNLNINLANNMVVDCIVVLVTCYV